MENDHNFMRWQADERELKNLTPVKVREMILECFYVAQGHTFRKIKEKLHMSHDEQNVIDSIRGAVKTAFKESGGDFNAPTKESLTKVLNILAAHAASWGTPKDVIEYHAAQIKKLIDRLE